MPDWFVPLLVRMPAALAGPFVVLMINVPMFRRLFWMAWYEWFSRAQGELGDLSFMNYGYQGEDAEQEEAFRAQLAEALPHCGQSLQLGMARLYQHTIEAAGVDMQGLDSLEIGSGRGGGSFLAAKVYDVRSHVGVDLASAAVDFCREHHRLPKLKFEAGDALKLPFEASALDVVINVESSHCYPDSARFLAEVARVLRPGGHLLLSDFRPRSKFPLFLERFKTAGFRIVETEDITDGVVRALEGASADKEDWIQESYPTPIQGLMRTFSGVKGTVIHRLFSQRRLVYTRVVAVLQD